jgi:hypothetical protein
MIRWLQLNSTSGDFMFGKLFAVCVTLWLASVSFDVSAQSYNTGSQTCTQNYSLYDYYSNGRYTHSSWDADGVTCNDNGGGFNDGGGYNDGGIIGPESGGVAQPLGLKIPNNPYAHAATCRSDQNGRWQHALEDVNLYISRNLFNRPRALQILTVTYDDNSTEDWMATGTAGDAALSPVPVSGSLHCSGG